MVKGKQSIAFETPPYIEESASIVGKKEGEGPLGTLFDMVEEDNLLKTLFSHAIHQKNFMSWVSY